jgi:4-amino-4-deoxy-L-arabinose transferase-like glycosyltransferase
MEVALVLALAFAVRAPFWEISVIDWDESVFILQAREMLWGHLPYTTLRDIKRPGSATLIAGAMLLFGERVLAARILAFACVAATALLLRLIVREIGGSRAAGLLAAILYVAFSARLGGLVAHTEVLLAPFSAAGVLLLLR